ncbi:response regulator [Candidatus Nitrosotenuis chungbukensis]|uniref:response regulator n=1 Tax=Candidatus Nitrosotenuis chungbukensis TaxID=1353246 RepID=UPI0005B2DD64|nr:response regulator [Candidatus Nitrosotenuis chungbukensis]WKT57591.1 response regulator [Candidatus Nitrosotenuis chungbukensis]
MSEEDDEPIIMIVDDASFMRKALRKIIESARITTKIIEAADGIEAVMKYKEYRPYLVTMDVLMPKADGIQALRAIKKIDPDAKVIMVSSSAKNHIVQDAMKLGALDYVLKPFDSARMNVILSRHARV